MLWRHPNGAGFGLDLQQFGFAAGEFGMRHSPPSAASDNLIANPNLLHWNTSTACDYRFILCYANLVEPRPGQVVAASHIWIIGTFGIDLRPVREKDHGPWGELEPVFDLASFEYAKDAGRTLHADGPGV
jgi:hypothetical protein